MRICAQLVQARREGVMTKKMRKLIERFKVTGGWRKILMFFVGVGFGLLSFFTGCVSSSDTDYSSSYWNDDGVEPASPQWNPDRPYYVTKVGENFYQVVLDWQPVTTNKYGRPKDNIVGYNVYRQKQGEEKRKIATTMEDYYVDRSSDLEEGAIYYYYVTAIDSMMRESVPSGVQNVKIEVDRSQVPSSPGDLVILPSKDGEGFIISWTPPTTNEDGSPLNDLAYYYIYRKEGINGEWELVAKIDKSKILYQDHGLEVGQAYYYRIIAVDEDGNYSKALEGGRNLLGRTDQLQPSRPTNLTVTPGDAYVNLAWSEPTTNADGTSLVDGDLIGYKIYRKKLYDTGDFELVKVLYRDTSWKDITVEPGEDYIYAVAAVDSSGNESVWSTPVSTAAGVEIPSAPEELSARLTETEFMLVWQRVTNTPVVEYRIYRSLTPEGPYQYYASSTADDDGNLSDAYWGKMLSRPNIGEDIYYWKVSAVSSQGIEGPLSAYVRVEPDPGYSIIEGESLVHRVIPYGTPFVYAMTFPYPWDNVSAMVFYPVNNTDYIEYYLDLDVNSTYTFDFYFMGMPDSSTFEIELDGGGLTVATGVFDTYSESPKPIKGSLTVDVGAGFGVTRSVKMTIRSGFSMGNVYLDKIVIRKISG